MSSVVDEIKDKVSCPDFLQREFGITRISRNRARSWRPEATHPDSLLVNDRDWYDFGSGKGGDVIDMAAESKFNGDKGQAIRYLAKEWGIKNVSDQKIEHEFNSYLAVLNEATKFYHGQLKREHLQYLRGRGLREDTINQLRIGWSDNPCEYLKSKSFTQEQINSAGILNFVNRIVIPYLRNDKAVYLIGRVSVWEETPSANREAKYIKLKRNEINEHPIWGFDTLRRSGQVIIAEGIFDAIACWQEGYAVVTAVTGAFSGEQKKDLYPALKGRSVLVCMDYDPETKAGQNFTSKLANELFEQGIDVSACFLKGAGEKVDIADVYANNPERGTLEEIFSKGKKWYIHRVKEISELKSESDRYKEITNFLKFCAKSFDGPRMMMIADEVAKTKQFNDTWLRELLKELKKAPSELEICELFTREYDCLFNEQLGWHEYSKDVWEKISEFNVKDKIGKMYGKYCTSRGVDAVYKLLKARLNRKELFNQEPKLLNFPNGMYNLEENKLVNHSREYFSSIQMTYEYDEKAECNKWLKFIDEITDGDERRQYLIQEMFGYCLTRDTRYQKCFCLLGTGANGKSKLLEVLEALVGERNASHVELAYLTSDFQRIGLLNSMVNICNDMKSDVSGTDAFFKAIVAGDPINGCYKGKDFVNFKPFCKMVFSSNRMITMKEVDYSVLRRIIFINFPITFVEDPQGKNERKRDEEISKNLLGELPGILNWSLRGLKALREQGGFTETADQLRLEEEMKVINNPLISFCDDILCNGGSHWGGLLNRKEIYGQYKKWCEETTTRVLSARCFWPRLREVINFEEVRTSDGRYIEIEGKK